MVSATLFKAPKISFVSRFLLLKRTQSLLDAVILSVSFIFAYLLRFDFNLQPRDLRSALVQLGFILPLQLAALYLFGVHNFIWRYISLRDAKRIVLAVAAASIPILLLRLCLAEEFVLFMVPLSIIIFNLCLASIGLLGIRGLRREIHEYNHRNRTISANLEKKAVLLIGAGRAGLMALSEIKSRGDICIDVKGFVDDDVLKKGAIINGVKVLGTTAAIPELARNNKIDHVIISMAQATREDFQRILNTCRNASIKVRVIPGLYELLQEKVTVSRIRDIEIEDLLGRSPIHLEKNAIENFVNNKVVMITGAGGSIGSEVVRQLGLYQANNLVLVERNEYALFQIEQEMKVKFPNLKVRPIIADINDVERMRRVFEKYCPEIVFHAAAHKHVPLMEENSPEALKNNVLGTEIIGRLAGKFQAEAFVLVSTDKAVNPSSIMGSSKRIAELVIQDLNNQFSTRFVAVRFGNVIGSNGSVIPTFKNQIKSGGPVTVTHPEMKRFFMTIPEATQLVMQAGALGKGGEIFILDMGKPVRILDLARETIKLSGLRPDVDIKIEFTGMRPGEKLVEELETDKEKLSKTAHPKIFIGEIAPYPAEEIKQMLEEVKVLCLTEDEEMIRKFITCFLPEAKLEDQFDEEFSEIEIDKFERSFTSEVMFKVAKAA